MGNILSHRIALDPTDHQRTYFAKACGVARFAYNWALAEWQEQYKAGGKPSAFALCRQLNSIKREQFPWILEVTKCAPQVAIGNLGLAFTNFFAGRASYPRFKKKGIHDAFAIDNDRPFKVDGCRVCIPRLGWVRTRECLRFTGKILSATISRTADRWFISIAVEVDHVPHARENQAAAVGVDFGCTNFATLSTGEVIEGPKPHKRLLGRMRRLNRSLHRKVKGSRNRMKAKRQVARLHARIGNIRDDFLHKFTTNLVRRFSVIGIEDLNVAGMTKNHSLARSILDQAPGEMRRQLDYKAPMYGSRIVAAPMFYPSTKICSACGVVVDTLPLSLRVWTCPECGTIHDRDGNASLNLERIAASSAVNACGAGSAGGGLTVAVKLPAVKQELDIINSAAG